MATMLNTQTAMPLFHLSSTSEDDDVHASTIRDSAMRVRDSARADVVQQSGILPYNAVDTHVHIFEPNLGPYSTDRAYTPASATLAELLSFRTKLSGSANPPSFVLVQPSPYGTDNTVLLSTLGTLRRQNCFARGIAVVDVDEIGGEELRAMHDRGVRGLRINKVADGKSFDLEDLRATIVKAAARIKHLPGWKLQLFAPSYVWRDLYATISSLPVVVIADHTGSLFGASKLQADVAANPRTQAGFESLVALAKEGRVLIKISALYRSSSSDTTNYDDMGPVIRELVKEIPDRLLWGSDWPHTGGGGENRAKSGNLSALESFRTVDNSGILRDLREWVGSKDAWVKLMVDNPREAFA